MATDFDVIVIGSGPGGYVTAIRAAQLGMKTAIVEREALGGVCLNWGCIPTKALLKSGEVYEQLGHLADYGLKVEKAGFDFDKVIQRSRKVAAQLNSGVGFLMKKHKIEVIEGTAKLEKGTPAPKVVVALKAGGSRAVQAKHVILATGARARTIPAAGLEPDGDRIWTYREAMVPKACPKSLIVVGSGAIGIEFASFYRALGADVTVVEALPRIVPVECRAARPMSKATSADSMSRPESACGSSTLSLATASSATTPGRRTRRITPGMPASGARSAWTRSWGWCIFPWNFRPATTMVAIAPATDCSARAWLRWISKPASASGIISWCTTVFGIWTFPARRFWSTSSSTAKL